MIYIDDKKDFLNIPRSYNGGDMSNYPTREETQQMIDESIGELDIPTKVSELDNDSKFVTEERLDEDVSKKADKSYVEDELAGKEDKRNKTQQLTDRSTDVEYPSAKAVYDYIGAAIGDIETLLSQI